MTTSAQVLLVPMVNGKLDRKNERYAMIITRTSNKLIVRDFSCERVFHLNESGAFVCAELPDIACVTP